MLSRPVERVAAAFRWRERSAVDAAVQDFFDPEFLNRLDEVVYFSEIVPDVAERITDLQLRDVTAVFRRRGVQLEVDDAVVGHLVRRGFDPVRGARGLARVVRAAVVVPAAEELVRARAAGADGVRLRVQVSDDDSLAVVVPD